MSSPRLDRFRIRRWRLLCWIAGCLGWIGAPCRGQTPIRIDFARPVTSSTHLLFGGCALDQTQPTAWARLAEAGVTQARFDVRLGVYSDPKKITLQQYKAAMGVPGGVADVNGSAWNWQRMDSSVALARQHGMATLSLLTYCPTWLSYSGDVHSPPRDWTVWEDLVTQIVRRYAGKIDRWEIWNEPNGPEFMDLEGSPYPAGKAGMLAAYLDFCRHTLAAVRASGVSVPVGGPVLATWNAESFFDDFLGQADVAAGLDFLSYHIYFHTPIPNRCFPPAVYALERKHGLGPLPLFITEWNSQSGVVEKPHLYKNSPEAVGWVGKSFVLFLQWGVRGATFYNMTAGKAIDDQLGGSFIMVNGEPQLFRYMKVFHLLSKVLGLGDPAGLIQVCDSRVEGLGDETQLAPNFVDSLYAVGCVNARNVPVAIVANPSSIPRSAGLSLTGLPAGDYQVLAYIVRPDHTPAEATVPTPLFTQTASASAGTIDLRVDAPASSVVGVRLERIVVAPAIPAITVQPAHQAARPGGTVTFLAGVDGQPAPACQWFRDGRVLPGTGATSLSLGSVRPADAGGYALGATNALGAAWSREAILGVEIAGLLAGDAFSDPGWRGLSHPNGNRYTQTLLTGPAATVSASPGEITRLSFVDLQDDIVQLEFSGAGTMTVTLNNASGPAAPLCYAQAVQYMKGHASVVIQGADATTNFAAFSVGKLTAFDPTGQWDLAQPVSPTNDPGRNGNPIFRSDVTYDGHADLARLSIQSSDGRFGGIFAANAAFSDVAGCTGIYAPDVTATGPVRVHDIRAYDEARPVLMFGAMANLETGLRVTGGNMEQPNARAVELTGVDHVRMAAGTDSHNRFETAKLNRARFECDGVDVTASVVVPAEGT